MYTYTHICTHTYISSREGHSERDTNEGTDWNFYRDMACSWPRGKYTGARGKGKKEGLIDEERRPPHSSLHHVRRYALEKLKKKMLHKSCRPERGSLTVRLMGAPSNYPNIVCFN